ncbi:MAG: threonine--tRNA ligase [Eubacteriales bacterium]|nr:threonine--tRNA ligase [Eubacteriales bacterium]
MRITLPDGNVKEYGEPMSAYDIAADIGEALKRTACVAEVDGQICDLRTVIDKDCSMRILTFADDEAKDAFRHTASHVLAMAVKRLYPEAKLAIGPAIEEGFYYDFDLPPLNREELDKIEKEMKKIIKRGHWLRRFELPREEAIALMRERGEDYKIELIEDLDTDAIISFYEMEEFVDLCAGPHLMNLRPIKAFKLLSSSGAYWRGDEKNKMLTRIYGTAYPDKEMLAARLAYLEDIKKRDHNKLGREMELFTTVDIVGQGLPLFMPKGAKMIQTLQRWVEDEEERRGYLRTITPLMAKSDLYKLSGHWDHYRDGMFVLGDAEKADEEEVMALRPMTCPFQYMIYKSKQRSYRDLPMRLAETSTLFRNEDSGEMHGLIRVRQFTISEAHIIIKPDQVQEEIANVLDLINYCMETLGIADDVSYRFSKWDPNDKEKYIGTEEEWERNQKTLRDVLVNMGLEFTEADGEAAFYGPKLDIQFKNVYGKEDTIITVQLDCALSEVYDMSYVDEDGQKKRPYIIHRTSVGCYERTLALLIEKYAGLFPTWLCPEQVRILPISEKFSDYADEVCTTLSRAGVSVTVDHRSEKIGYKIREARLQRVPYMLVVGQKEAAEGTVSVRSRYEGDEGSMKPAEFTARITEEIRQRVIREIKQDDNAK